MSNSQNNQLSNQLLSANGSENSRVVVSGDALDLKVTPLVNVKGRDLDKVSFDLLNGKFYFYFINSTIMEINFPSLEDYGTGGIGKYGPDGKEGTDGYNGCDGNEGEKGCPGIPGFMGKIGLEGDKGDTGYKGISGEQGLKGFPGLIGPIGEQGYPSLSDLCLSCTPDNAGPRGIRGPKGYDEEHHTYVRISQPPIQNINTVWGRPVFDITEKTTEKTTYRTTYSQDTTEGPGPYTTVECTRTVTVTFCPGTGTTGTTDSTSTTETSTTFTTGTTGISTTDTTHTAGTSTLTTATTGTTTTTLYCPECPTGTTKCPTCTDPVTTTTLCPTCHNTGTTMSTITTTCYINWGVCWGYGPDMTGNNDLDKFIIDNLINFLPDNDPVGFTPNCSGSCFVHFAYPKRCVAAFVDTFNLPNGGFSGPTEVIRENCDGILSVWYIHQATYSAGTREVIVTYPCTTTFATFTTPSASTTRIETTSPTLSTHSTTIGTTATTATLGTTTTIESSSTSTSTTLNELRITTDKVIVGEIPMPPDDGQIDSVGLTIPNKAGWFIPNKFGYYANFSTGENLTTLFADKNIELPLDAASYYELVTLTDAVTGQRVQKEIEFIILPNTGRTRLQVTTTSIEVGYQKETSYNGQLAASGGYPPYQFFTIVGNITKDWYEFDSPGGRFIPTTSIIPLGATTYYLDITVKDSHNNVSRIKKVEFVIYPQKTTTTTRTTTTTPEPLKITTSSIYVGVRSSTAILAQLETNLACPDGTVWGCNSNNINNANGGLPWYQFDINQGKYIPTAVAIFNDQQNYTDFVWVTFPDGRVASRWIDCVINSPEGTTNNTTYTSLQALDLVTDKLVIGKEGETSRNVQLDAAGGNPPYRFEYIQGNDGSSFHDFEPSTGKFISNNTVIPVGFAGSWFSSYRVIDAFGSTSQDKMIEFIILEKDAIETTTLPPFRIITDEIYVGIVSKPSLTSTISLAGGIGPFVYSCPSNPPLILNVNTGVFTGGAVIPSTLTSYYRVLTVKDLATGRVVTKQVLFRIDTSSSTTSTTVMPPVLTILTTEIDVGTVGSAALANTFLATSGTPNALGQYSWSVNTLGFPTPWYTSLVPKSGIYSPSGSLILPGTVDYWIRVTVTDSVGSTDTQDVLCKVIEEEPPAGNLVINTTRFSIGEVGKLPNKSTLSASGGVPPYFWEADQEVLINSPWFVFSGNTGVFTPKVIIPVGTDTYYMDVSVSDSFGNSATKLIEFYITKTVLAIQNKTVTIGNAGFVPTLNFSVTATGGSLPYTYSISVQKPWYTFNPETGGFKTNGTIIPYTQTNYTAVITVRDNLGATASATITFQIGISELSIKTSSVYVGFVNNLAEDGKLEAQGGLPPYTWALNVTKSWYTFATSTGALTHTTTKIPLTAITYTGTATVTDSKSQVATRIITFTIGVPEPLVLNSNTYTIGYVGEEPLVETITNTASGGVLPYTYTVNITKAWYSFAAGVWIATGTIIPLTQTNYSYTLTVKDKLGASATATITCNVSIRPLVITTSSIYVGIGSKTAIAGKFAVTGGTAPYTWSYPTIKSYYTLNATTGALTPTTVKIPVTELDYGHTVRVTDSKGATITKVISFNIDSVEVLVLEPATYDIGYIGEAPTLSPITAAASGGLLPYTYTIDVTKPWYTYTASNSTWTKTSTIIPLTQNDYVVKITVKDSSGQSKTSAFTFRVTTRPLTITTDAIVVGTANQLPLAGTFRASGGKPPYTWTYTPKAYYLLDTATGALSRSGTKIPLNALTYVNNVKVTDTNSATVTKSITFDITSIPILSIYNETFNIGEAGSTPVISPALTARGGVPPYKYTINLSVAWYVYSTTTGEWDLNGTVISKTATNYTVIVTVTDASGQTAKANAIFNVTPYYNLEITSDVFLWGQVWKHLGCIEWSLYGYSSTSFELLSTGGVGPWNWSYEEVGGNTLPALSIGSGNNVHMIYPDGYCPPANAKNWTTKHIVDVDYTVRDSSGHSKTKRIKTVILPSANSIKWPTAAPILKTNSTSWYVSGGVYGTVENMKCIYFKPVVDPCGFSLAKAGISFTVTGLPDSFLYWGSEQVNIAPKNNLIPTGTASFTITITLGLYNGYGIPATTLSTKGYTITIKAGSGLLDMSAIEETTPNLEIITNVVTVGKAGSFPKKTLLFARGGSLPYYWTLSEELPYYALDRCTGVLNPINVIPSNATNKNILVSVVDATGREEIAEVNFKLI